MSYHRVYSRAYKYNNFRFTQTCASVTVRNPCLAKWFFVGKINEQLNTHFSIRNATAIQSGLARVYTPCGPCRLVGNNVMRRYENRFNKNNLNIKNAFRAGFWIQRMRDRACAVRAIAAIVCEARNQENCFYYLCFLYFWIFSHPFCVSFTRNSCESRSRFFLVHLISSSAHAIDPLSLNGRCSLSTRSHSHLIINYILIYVVSDCITTSHANNV